MIKEALEYLESLIRLGIESETVHQTEDTVWKAVTINGKREIEEFPACVWTRAHRFHTLVGFLDYLNSHHCINDSGPVFVGQDQVIALLDYGKPTSHQVRLDLKPSEEWTALGALAKGVGQKALWRALCTRLDGCVDAALFQAIAGLKVASASKSESTIDILGLDARGGGSSIQVTFAGANGPESRTIPQVWDFSVTRWECFNGRFGVATRLELIQDNGGIQFIFHPRRLDQVEQTARLALVDHLRVALKETPRYTVHEGEV